MFAQWPWDKFESLSVWYVRGSFDGDGDRYWRGVWRASEREDGEKKGGLAVRIQIDDEHRGRLGESKRDRGGQNRSRRGQKLERLAGLHERAVVEVGGSRADHISTPYK